MRTLVTFLAAFVLGCSPAPTPSAADPSTASGQTASTIQASAWADESRRVLAELAAQAESEGAPAGAFAALIDPSASDAAIDADVTRLATFFTQGLADPAQADPSWRVARMPVAFDIAAARALAPSALRANLLARAPQDPAYGALARDLAALPDTPETAPQRLSLRASLERWRWLPHPLPTDRIEVRTAQYDVRLIRAGARIATHKVVIGRTRTPTPSFATAISAVTLNPMWRPPLGIARAEILPMIARDPSRAESLGYRVLDANGAVRAPSAKLEAGDAIVQLPGDANALGRVKFEMANPFAIYLHDTPAQTLFARNERAFSHGCVRVEGARDLAAAVLDEDGANLDAAIAARVTQQRALAAPLPVFIIYMTADVDAAGAVAISPDVYKRDARLVRALDGAAERGSEIGRPVCAAS